MLNLLIARHGNTFDKGDEILRVGLRTDIPLSRSGQAQSQLIGTYLCRHYPKIDIVYCSELKRTEQTARIALKTYPAPLRPIRTPLLNEIDYGIDDGKPESEVINRIGQEALNKWETESILPKGWLFSKEKVIQEIKCFIDELMINPSINTVLIVTSNGIARFFQSLLDINEQKKPSLPHKLGTGNLSYFIHNGESWECKFWDLKP